MLKKDLSNKITYMNFFMACLIVAMHSSCVTSLNPNQSFYRMCYFIQVLISKMADAAVPLFFMMSGFLLFRNYKIDNYLNVIIRRIRSLIVPYLIWSILGWIVYALLTHISFLRKYVNQEAIPLDIQSILSDVMYATYDPPIWFI